MLGEPRNQSVRDGGKTNPSAFQDWNCSFRFSISKLTDLRVLTASAESAVSWDGRPNKLFLKLVTKFQPSVLKVFSSEDRNSILFLNFCINLQVLQNSE